MEVCSFDLFRFVGSLDLIFTVMFTFLLSMYINFDTIFSGQVLKHENLGDYLDLKVPSLKSFHSKKSNGEVKSSSIRLLANVMELVKRLD